MKRYECLSHCCKRQKAHLIQWQKDKIRQARKSKAQKVLAGASIKDVQKEFGGKLSRKNIPRGDWSDPSKKSIEMKFLTDVMCARITYMYQLAVKHHKGNVVDILQSIHAILYHYSATDETADVAHSQCPIGSDSWCKFLVAVAQGSRRPKHPNYLGQEAVELVKKVFDHYNYDKDCFVEQIADGQTSNHNEALHHILFNMVPKTISPFIKN